jgi:iron complex transport system permease protein
MGTAVLVYLIAAAGRMPPVALLLAGAAVSTMLGGVVWLVLALADQDLSRIVVWLMGGFSGRNPWLSLLSASGPLLLGLGMLWASSRMLDALCSGEESAQALGLRIGPAYAFIMVGASLTTAAAVAAGGVIGFVGLVAPHAARRMLGGANVRLIPASALCGAILLVAADGLARSVKPPFDLPVGVITALLGGPFFLVVLRRQVIKAVVGGN